MLRKTIILSFASLAVGCATISEESCNQGSWENLGYGDGRSGESRDHFSKIAKTCAKYGISANAAEYRLGYDQGLPLYCTYDKGFDHGESGVWLHTECRDINAASYLDGFDEGRVVYGIRQEYDVLIEAYEETREHVIFIDERLSQEGISDTDRARLLRDRRTVMRELDENRIDIRAFEIVQGWPKRQLPLPVKTHGFN